jgi:hypothetical protein
MQMVEQSAANRNGYPASAYYELGTVLPSQYYDIVRYNNVLEGERKLMLAVLQDAIQCYLRNAHPKTLHQGALLREVRAWFYSDGRGADRSPFGFQNVCSSLGIEPMSLRKRVCELAERGTPIRRLRRLPQAANSDTRITAGTSRFRRRQARR